MKTVIEKRLKEPIPDYVSSLHSRLASKKGQIAAVESESGQYVVAETLLQAAAAARAHFPGKVFYFIRIGYPYVHRQTGRPAKRVSVKNKGAY